MKKQLFFSTIVFVAFFPTTARGQATNVYVTPAGTATGNCPAGTSAAPNLTPSGFNTSGNWGTGTGRIGAGTTVLVCGTFTQAAHSGPLLTFQGGGSSQNPIVLKLDATTNITAPSWTGTVIEAGSFSYWTIDGGAARTSIMQSTLAGSSGHPCPGGTCQYVDNGYCVDASGSNVTVQNITCANMYVNYCPSGNYLDSSCNDPNNVGGCIIMSNNSNVLVQNNVCYDTSDPLVYALGGTISPSNIVFKGNTVYHVCTGFQVSDNRTSGNMTGLVVQGNFIHDGFNWANYPGAKCHVDGMHLFINNSGPTATGTQISGNFIYGNFGNAINAFIFTEDPSLTSWIGTQVFNNILEDDTPASIPSQAGNGFISLNGTNGKVFNNTMNGLTTALNLNGSGYMVENNTSSNVYAAYVRGSGNLTTADYNNYYNIGPGGMSGGGDSFASWESSCACDSHSSNGNPNFSGNVTLPVGSPAATNYLPSSSSAMLPKKGQNLTSLSITPLDSDFADVTRPGSGSCSTLGSASCWDIGAYAVNSVVVLPLPPANLTATLQ
jgi:hypothetical protein